MKNTLRWLVPTLTAGVLFNLSLNSTSSLAGWGLVLGTLYALAAILGAWELYGRGKP